MQFYYSFSWWTAAIILVVAAIVVIFSYRRAYKPLSRRYRVLLIALRVMAVALLLICLLDPTLVSREEITKKANLLFLVDDSQSMSLSDEDDGIARIDAVKDALINNEDGPIKNLADRFSLQFYQFSSDCAHVDKLSPTAKGTLTDIGKAISKLAGEWRGQSTAGIVLVTDGGNNAGESPLEAVRQMDMPIYSVGVGSTKMPRDIQVAKVEVSPVAYVDHSLPIKVVVRSSGYDGRDVQVSLMQGRTGQQDAPPVLRDSVSLKLDSKVSEQVVDLQFLPRQEGTLNFSITVPVAPEELTDQNNVYPFFVKVVKTKLKVLYVEGSPRWEYTFLRRALQRDPNIEPTYLVNLKGAEEGSKLYSDESLLSRFPAARKELFLYDVLILGDLSPSFFTKEQLNMINDFVENKGGSVVFLGGKLSLGSGGFAETGLAAMLPVEIGTGGARQVKGAFNPVLTPDGLRHPVTRLSDDEAENVAMWRDLPVLTQFYMGAGIKLGATVLAEHQRDRGQPIIALQRYGKGMVLLITSDSLWNWSFGVYPYGGDDSNYGKFWSGTVRWLASMNTEADRVNVRTDKGSYHRDEKVSIIAYVYDESFRPVEDAKLRGNIQMPDGISSDLSFTLGGGGRYSAEFKPTIDGHYAVQVEAEYAGSLLGKGSADFIVRTTVLEFQDVQLKEDLLKTLAEVSGGSYHHLKDVDNLPASVKDVKDTYSSITERSLWDNWLLFVIAMMLLGAEWFLRKRRGLV